MNTEEPLYFGRTQGIVMRRVVDRGFGFIRDRVGEEFFFHQSDLENCTFESLQEGITVSFRAKATPKGARAVEVRIVDGG